MGFPRKKLSGVVRALDPGASVDRPLNNMITGAADKVLGEGNAVSRGFNEQQKFRERLVGKKSQADIATDKARADAAAHQQMLKDLPQLEDRKTLESLGDAGRFQASTVANPENSPWKSMAMQQQSIDQGIAGDALSRNSAIAAAQGRSTVAGGRGAATGGMERLGLANMQSLASGRQGLADTGGKQRQAISQQAAGQGLSTGQFNTGQLNQAGQANIGAQRNDANQQNAFNQLKYGEQMKFKGGQATGDALSKSGGKK